jgi:hypothetical protein
MKRTIEMLLAEETVQQPGWLYLSFADDDRGGFLGAVITYASGIGTAVMKCYALGINPGGEVLSFEIDDEIVDGIPNWAINRLLTVQQVEEVLGECKTLGELEKENEEDATSQGNES